MLHALRSGILDVPRRRVTTIPYMYRRYPRYEKKGTQNSFGGIEEKIKI